MKHLLGGKGANLAEMASIGLPVPAGFTLTTELCTYFYENNGSYPPELRKQAESALAFVESRSGRRFGDARKPLLLAVRSGARASMPGMMDTVLNLGLNDQTVEALAQETGDRRFAFDSYRRFVQTYAVTVLTKRPELRRRFEKVMERAKQRREVTDDHELLPEDLEQLVSDYKTAVHLELGVPFPEDPEEQLWGAIGAVFNSWMNPRAKTYRQLHGMPESWGTAVNVQAMVFGNLGKDCATGVAFTRNPSSGLNDVYGEWLANAQGEDVLLGRRRPQEMTIKAPLAQRGEMPSLEEAMPNLFRELSAVCRQLEDHYKDMQDIEFTIQQGKLYMLQTRTGKRTAHAAVQIAVDLAQEGLISKGSALLRLKPELITQLLHPTLDVSSTDRWQRLTRGLPASPGAATGKVVFTADEAEKRSRNGEKVLLVRIETSPDDIHGLHAAEGVLTTRCGVTSHAAVVARTMGRPCVAGAREVQVDYSARRMTLGDVTVLEGQVVTIDGNTGEVLLGEVPTVTPKLSKAFRTIMTWADEYRTLQVRCNAETPCDAQRAKLFGAEGIGLVRTEHMFFEGERIVAMRQMILAADEKERQSALQKLLEMQRQDFADLFEIFPSVTVRLLDAPLHEFLPSTEAGLAAVAAVGARVPASLERVKRRTAELREANPMLGHRGCRLAITYPEICQMQTRAIFEAVASLGRRQQVVPTVEVMVPLVSHVEEFKILKLVVEKTALAVQREQGMSFKYHIGAMVELPRACLQAEKLAQSAEFFSFGSNDLTQSTYGLSRDDASTFLPDYKAKGILEQDPFVTLDTEGVGELILLAVERGRKARSGMKMGICGEHGGDPGSIDFCNRIGLDYVSCSPWRVPLARLAAAQAALRADHGDGDRAKRNGRRTTTMTMTATTQPRLGRCRSW